MRKLLVFSALGLVVLMPGPGVQAQQAQPDARPAAEADIASATRSRLNELLEMVNGGDAARIKAYVDSAAAKPEPEAVSYLLDLHRRSHGLDLVRVEPAEDKGVIAVVRNRLTGDEQALSFKVEPQAPHRVTALHEVPLELAAIPGLRPPPEPRVGGGLGRVPDRT